MADTIYRGMTIYQGSDNLWRWNDVLGAATCTETFTTEEAAMNAVDRFKREQRANAAAEK